MANPDGSLLGDGFTDVKDNKLVYKEKVTLKKACTRYTSGKRFAKPEKLLAYKN
jgi:hypothetical protein